MIIRSDMATNNTKQAVWIAIGSLFSFGFGIVSSMILSRYFEKGDYGTYKQVLYVYNALLTVFTLGLPKAYSYFLPRVERSQAKNLIKKITNLFLLLGFFFSITLFVGASQIADWLKNPNLTYGLRLFSVVPLLMLPTMGLEGILATYRKTMFMTFYTIITRSVMLLCVSAPVILWNGDYVDAIIGFDIASVVAFIMALYFKYYPVRAEGNKDCEVSYHQIFSFSLPLLFASLWGVVIHSADQFFVSRYFGTEVFAEFSNGAIELPFVGIIISACAAVLSPVFSRLSHEQVNFQKEVMPLWMSVFEKTAKLIYPLVLYCIFFADLVMVLMYGEPYQVSATYFQIKLMANFFTVISFAPLIINTGRVKYYQNVHMYGAIVLVVLEYLSILFFNSPYVLTTVSVACHIGRIICMLWVVAKMFDVKFYQIFPVALLFKIMLPSIVILTGIRILCDSIGQYVRNSILLFATTFVAYFIIYFIYSLFAHIDYKSIIKPLNIR